MSFTRGLLPKHLLYYRIAPPAAAATADAAAAAAAVGRACRQIYGLTVS